MASPTITGSMWRPTQWKDKGPTLTDAEPEHRDHALGQRLPDAGESVRRNRQHCRPEEGLAEAVQRRGGENDAQRAGAGEPGQPDDGQDRGDREQSERADAVDDRPGEEAQDQHDGRGVNQDPTGVELSFCNPFHDRRDPTVGADFRGGQRDHQKQEDDEEGMARRKADQAPERESEDDDDRAGEIRRPAEHLADLEVTPPDMTVEEAAALFPSDL